MLVGRLPECAVPPSSHVDGNIDGKDEDVDEGRG
jgi:hypothetical protein